MDQDCWQIRETDFPGTGSNEALKFLLNYAILAPSSHNTQPWKFAVKDTQISVFADKSRWLKAADPTQRELYISVGCALENLLIAGDHFGYKTETTYFPDRNREEYVAQVSFTLGGKPEIPDALFAALTVRHTNRGMYDGRKIPREDLERLGACCSEDDLRVDFSDDDALKIEADKLFADSVMIHFADSAYTKELAYWYGQGVFGTPWLISKIGQIALSHAHMGKSTSEKGSKALMSASHLGLISSKGDDNLSRVKVGEAFERLALTATSLGIMVHPLSEPCEIPEMRQRLQTLVELEETPQHPFRLGYAHPEKHTPRRPLSDVTI